VQIEERTEHDPTSDLDLPNAYMRWAILAVEEVAGKRGVDIILREAGLGHMVDNYPPQNMNMDGLKYADYSALNAAILNFYGRAGKSFAMRIGRISARYSIQEESALFGFAGLALKLLPTHMQLKLGLQNMVSGFRKLAAQKGQTLDLAIVEEPDKFKYISRACPNCNGKVSDKPMCWVFIGVLREGASFVTGGKEFEVKETSCMAVGDDACVFEISKTPLPK